MPSSCESTRASFRRSQSPAAFPKAFPRRPPAQLQSALLNQDALVSHLIRVAATVGSAVEVGELERKMVTALFASTRASTHLEQYLNPDAQGVAHES